MTHIDPAQIQLISITDERLTDSREGKAITLRYETRGGDSLTATYIVGERRVRDECLVIVARDWLHKTCKDIAQATESWALTDDQLKETEHPLKFRIAMDLSP